MSSDYNLDLAGEFVLALMAFEIHDDGRAWKGFPWEVLAHLHDQGLISDPRTKAKSVVLTEAGEAQSRAARDRLLCTAANAPSALPRESPPANRRGAFTDLQYRHIETLMAPICAAPADPAVRDQLRIGFRVEGRSVVLFESRPAFLPPHEWQEEPVAKFTHVKSTNRWKLLCMFRDLKWRGYEPFPESHELSTLVDEVRRDPTGIFWG